MAIHYCYAEFQVPTVVITKIYIPWHKTSWSPVKINWSFGGRYRLHIRGLRVSQEGNQHKAGRTSNLKMVAMLFRNVGWLSTDYTVLYPRRYKCSTYFWIVVLWVTTPCALLTGYYELFGEKRCRYVFSPWRQKQAACTSEVLVITYHHNLANHILNPPPTKTSNLIGFFTWNNL
jgi:hypothetical protein